MSTFNRGPFWKICFSSQTTQYSLSVGILCSVYLMICERNKTSHIYLMPRFETCFFIISSDCMCTRQLGQKGPEFKCAVCAKRRKIRQK